MLIAIFLGPVVLVAMLWALARWLPRNAARQPDSLPAELITGCRGWPEDRDTVQPDTACRGCARWLSTSAERRPPPLMVAILPSGMHCPNRVRI